MDCSSTKVFEPEVQATLPQRETLELHPPERETLEPHPTGRETLEPPVTKLMTERLHYVALAHVVRDANVNTHARMHYARIVH
jgi:hypothetical protein